MKGFDVFMARIDVYLPQENKEKIRRYAREEYGENESQYVSKIIFQHIKQKENGNKEKQDLQAEIQSLKRTQIETGKMLTAILNMLNTYFTAFAGDEQNSSQFYPVKTVPHEWTVKSMTIAESDIRMARYNNLTK